ncbi:hypothetical protein NDU88_005271 [Pleurodeles waltl]|uniref:Uncharacterized protein n=1 Tax=Pleurodeles waltl TaxID=8319 RepID=A0AAV7MAR0_PLEWA|nr:hypothetical protein NDU88_005271 [Pleurodeles waltl]
MLQFFDTTRALNTPLVGWSGLQLWRPPSPFSVRCRPQFCGKSGPLRPTLTAAFFSARHSQHPQLPSSIARSPQWPTFTAVFFAFCAAWHSQRPQLRNSTARHSKTAPLETLLLSLEAETSQQPRKNELVCTEGAAGEVADPPNSPPTTPACNTVIKLP